MGRNNNGDVENKEELSVVEMNIGDKVVIENERSFKFY